MEITYQRNLHKSYMCIEENEDIIEEHEMMMLQRYKVPQLLPLQMMVQDGKVQYWFEITGKQQLKDYLGNRPVGMGHLKKMLFSLEQLCQRMPEFLLKEERICLSEELLYIDLTDETVYFTYLPFRQGDFPEEFRHWMEEILKKIDHQDRQCTVLAYDLYEKVRRENISIRELLSRQQWGIQSVEGVLEERKAEQAEERQTEAEKREEKEAKEKRRMKEKKPESVSMNKIKEVCAELKEKVEGQPLEIIEKYKETVGRWQKHKKQEMQEKQVKTGEKSGQPEQKVPCFREKKEMENQEVKNPTRPLELHPGSPEGKLIYQGRNDCRDFWIEKEEFLVGRSIQQADGRIDTDGVSRIHAKITRRKGEYYIEDLNSTNGTYLNEKLLEYHKEWKLKRNDRIRFGIEEYVFC